MSIRFAFYDFDGTLVSSNVVTQYAWFARNAPSRRDAAARTAKLALGVPLLFALDLYSRRFFNEVFYRAYRGMSQAWLADKSQELFDSTIRPAVYPGAKQLVELDRDAGYQTVLVTGSLDFALVPVARFFGFDHVISNSIRFRDGIATGELEPPLIAEREKVEAMGRLCRQYNVESAQSKAYSDSMSDLPMLEAVGLPSAVNPDRRLRRIARQRAWPVIDLK